MELLEFEKQMKKILHKASEASGMSLEWQLVSCDPDCVSDFGCDSDGSLTIGGDSFLLKIKDMTRIRYRWNEETDDSDCFYRFDFGKNIYLDCCFNDCTTGCYYHVKYFDTHKALLNKDQAIELIKQCIEKDNVNDKI